MAQHQRGCHRQHIPEIGVTLTNDLWPPKSNQVIRRRLMVIPFKFHGIAQIVHEIWCSQHLTLKAWPWPLTTDLENQVFSSKYFPSVSWKLFEAIMKYHGNKQTTGESKNITPSLTMSGGWLKHKETLLLDNIANILFCLYQPSILQLFHTGQVPPTDGLRRNICSTMIPALYPSCCPDKKGQYFPSQHLYQII